MSPLPAALPPFDVPTPTGTHAAVSTGPAVSAATLATERRWTTYTVRPGDTLYDIAERHGTTVQALVARNSLAQGGRWLMPGQKVSVPGTASSSSDGSASSRGGSSTARPSATVTVTVRPGDTLSHIAAREGVTVGELARANGISNPRLIFPGQKITVPGSDSSSSDSSRSAAPTTSTTTKSTPKRSSATRSGTTVTVRPGDTMSHIAARHGVALDTLLRANPDVDPRRLWVGQKVLVPGSSSSGSSSSTASSSTAAPQRPWTQDTIGDTKKGEKVEDTFLHYTYSSAVARSAAANREYLAEVPVPSAAETKQLITETARRHGVDPKLMLALAYQESGWNQRAVSPANAIGVMQVIPASGEWASGLIGRDLNLLDPHDNVTAGVVIMRALLRSAGSEAEAIGGYYQGLASVNKHGLFADTQHYVRSIRALRDRM